MLTQLFEDRSHGVEVHAEAAPIPGFQPCDCAIIVAEGLACSKVRRVCGATSKAERERFCVSDQGVLALTGYAIAIEDHNSLKAGRPMPMDIEWARTARMASSISFKPGQRR